MGRNQVTINIDGQKLREIMKDHNMVFSERAQKYGVTRQAVNQWMTSGRIPPRALCEIALDGKISAEELDEIVISSKPEPEGKRKWQITIEEL